MFRAHWGISYNNQLIDRIFLAFLLLKFVPRSVNIICLEIGEWDSTFTVFYGIFTRCHVLGMDSTDEHRFCPL